MKLEAFYISYTLLLFQIAEVVSDVFGSSEYSPLVPKDLNKSGQEEIKHVYDENNCQDIHFPEGLADLPPLLLELIKLGLYACCCGSCYYFIRNI